MGLLGLAFKIAFVLVVLVVSVAGLLYASDFAVEATVVDKDCGPLLGDNGQVTVRTKLFGIEHTMGGLPASQCSLVQQDNFVEYRIRSGRTSLYESEGGRCIYDSVDGIGGCPGA
jgi:hypothetical protein